MVAGHDVGILVLFEADAMAGAVDEVLAVAGIGDDPRATSSTASHSVPTAAAATAAAWASCSTAYNSQNGAGGSPVNTVRVMSEQYPFITPPKSQTTASPGPMRRAPASWWGLAELGPLPTMAKLTCWCPSSINRRLMSAETSASLRPMRGMSPATSWPATRSAASEARARAATSSSSFTARKW